MRVVACACCACATQPMPMSQELCALKGGAASSLPLPLSPVVTSSSRARFSPAWSARPSSVALASAPDFSPSSRCRALVHASRLPVAFLRSFAQPSRLAVRSSLAVPRAATSPERTAGRTPSKHASRANEGHTRPRLSQSCSFMQQQKSRVEVFASYVSASSYSCTACFSFKVVLLVLRVCGESGGAAHLLAEGDPRGVASRRGVLERCDAARAEGQRRHRTVPGPAQRFVPAICGDLW